MILEMGLLESQPKKRGKWPLAILAAAAPLTLAALLLELVGAFQGPLAAYEIATLRRSLPTEPFLPGAVSYLAVLLVHMFVCAAAMWTAWSMLRPLPDRKLLLSWGIGLGVVLVAVVAFLASRELAAPRLSYFLFRDLYEGTGAGRAMLAEVGPMAALDLAALLPIVFGVLAVTLMAAAANGQYRLLAQWTGDPHADEEARLAIVHARLKRCLYALTLVLVTGTVSASWFFHLPTRLYFSEAGIGCCFDMAGKAIEGVSDLTKQNIQQLGSLRARLADYAGELSIMWGGVFTLTLAAAVGLPMLMVQRRLNDFLEGLKPPKRAQQVRTRLAEAGVIGKGGEHAKVVLALLAPLASGPVANFLQAAASG